MATIQPATTNWCPNPSFETNTTGWSFGVPGAVRINTDAYAGSWSMEVTANATSNISCAMTTFIPVTPDQSVAGMVHALSRQVAGACLMRIAFYTAGAVEITGLDNEIEVPLSVDPLNWTTIEYEAQAPATAASCIIRVIFRTTTGNVIGQAYVFDAVDLRIDQQNDAYFDGSLPGASWVGTAHGSASIRAAKTFVDTVGHDSEDFSVAYRIWSVDDDLNDDTELTEWIDGGEVTCNIEDDIKKKATFEFKNLNVLQPFVTRLKVYMEKYVENVLIDSEPLGVFSIDMPDGTVEYRSRFGTVEAMDITVELADSARGKQFVYKKGLNILGNAEDRVRYGRGYKVNFPDDGKKFSATQRFPPWMGDLELVNKLLEMANYHGCYGDGNGIITTQKIKQLSQMQPVVKIKPWEVFEIIETNDVEQLCNVVKVYKDNADDDPLFAIRRNDDPTDPVSTVNMRYKAKVLSDSEVDSQTEANELAVRTLEEGKSFDKTLELTIVPNPYLRVNNVLELTFDQEDGTCYCGRYWIREWKLPLGEPFFMTVTANRIQKFHAGIPD